MHLDLWCTWYSVYSAQCHTVTALGSIMLACVYRQTPRLQATECRHDTYPESRHFLLWDWAASAPSAQPQSQHANRQDTCMGVPPIPSMSRCREPQRHSLYTHMSTHSSMPPISLLLRTVLPSVQSCWVAVSFIALMSPNLRHQLLRRVPGSCTHSIFCGDYHWQPTKCYCQWQ